MVRDPARISGADCCCPERRSRGTTGLDLAEVGRADDGEPAEGAATRSLSVKVKVAIEGEGKPPHYELSLVFRGPSKSQITLVDGSDDGKTR